MIHSLPLFQQLDSNNLMGLHYIEGENNFLLNLVAILFGLFYHDIPCDAVKVVKWKNSSASSTGDIIL